MMTEARAADTMVGVLGGGQLAAMMGDAGERLRVRLRVIDPAPDASAARVAAHVRASWDDESALRELARGVECVTLETESVPPAAVRYLDSCGVPSRPGVASLLATGDRLAERRLLVRLGIPTAEFRPASSNDDVRSAYEQLGGDVIAKTRTLGYDGKGQLRLRNASDAEGAWERLGGRPLIVERVVPFRRELSLVSVRSLTGEIRHYPLVHNIHSRGILSITHAPAGDVPESLQATAEGWATRLMEDLDHVGALAIELFDTGDGLVVNELAPRVHNSGHWTIDAAACSQFENHLRAILGRDLGDTHALAHATMINLIGTVPDADTVLHIDPEARLHIYGKKPRPGRKLGHVTLVDTDPDRLARRVTELLARAGIDDDVAPAQPGSSAAAPQKERHQS